MSTPKVLNCLPEIAPAEWQAYKETACREPLDIHKPSPAFQKAFADLAKAAGVTVLEVVMLIKQRKIRATFRGVTFKTREIVGKARSIESEAVARLTALGVSPDQAAYQVRTMMVAAMEREEVPASTAAA